VASIISPCTPDWFPVPFDVVVVFSSNFLPERLSDGAFLRRLGYKIEVPPQTPAEYQQLFRQACAQYGIAFDAAAFDYLLSGLHAKDETPLLACYPRDLIRQVRDLARYESTPPALSQRAGLGLAQLLCRRRRPPRRRRTAEKGTRTPRHSTQSA
jgi:hypothetical protein